MSDDIDPKALAAARRLVAKAEAQAATKAAADKISAEAKRKNRLRTFRASQLGREIEAVQATGNRHPSVELARQHIAAVRAKFGNHRDPLMVLPEEIT